MLEVLKNHVSNSDVEDQGHQVARTEVLLYYLMAGTLKKNQTNPNQQPEIIFWHWCQLAWNTSCLQSSVLSLWNRIAASSCLLGMAPGPVWLLNDAWVLSRSMLAQARGHSNNMTVKAAAQQCSWMFPTTDPFTGMTVVTVAFPAQCSGL